MLDSIVLCLLLSALFLKPNAHTSLAKDTKLRGVRDKFFECELPVVERTPRHRGKSKSARATLSATEQLVRVDARLRRVVTKACRNSQPAAMVVKTLEAFGMAIFGSSSGAGSMPKQGWWTTLLTQAPVITPLGDNNNGPWRVQFLFDAKAGSGGFHRLLLHAICQYHGLATVSQMTQAHRTLVVTGQRFAHQHTLLDQLIDDAAQVHVLEEPWTLTNETKVAEEGEWAVVQS